MNYKIFPPSNELKDIVKQYVVFHSFENIENMLFLPNGGSFIIFNRDVFNISDKSCYINFI